MMPPPGCKFGSALPDHCVAASGYVYRYANLKYRSREGILVPPLRERWNSAELGHHAVIWKATSWLDRSNFHAKCQINGAIRPDGRLCFQENRPPLRSCTNSLLQRRQDNCSHYTTALSAVKIQLEWKSHLFPVARYHPTGGERAEGASSWPDWLTAVINLGICNFSVKNSFYISGDVQVCINFADRMYSILRGRTRTNRRRKSLCGISLTAEKLSTPRSQVCTHLTAKNAARFCWLYHYGYRPYRSVATINVWSQNCLYYYHAIAFCHLGLTPPPDKARTISY